MSKGTQKSMPTTDAPSEHRIWALDRKLDKEHVAFPAFVCRFKYFDRLEAHRAYRDLLDHGRISAQRLKKLRPDYEHFKRNSDDLYRCERFTEKSSKMVIRNASVHVQEAGLKQVEANMRQHLDKHGPKERGRGHATMTNVTEGISDSTA
ncbi:unnamed protein product [Mortierella alpina]